MLLTYIALALAGPGQGNAENEPTGNMAVDNLTATTENAGACLASGAVSPSAAVRLQWRVTNRNDAIFRTRVYLRIEPEQPYYVQPKEYALTSGGFVEEWGQQRPTWTQGYVEPKIGYGVFTYTGRVENGTKNRESVNWVFRVAVERISDGSEVMSREVIWRKTYGTCALPGDTTTPTVRGPLLT